MGLDLRVPTSPITGAFGLAITVTRPAPDNTPVTTEGVWVPPLIEEQPVGSDLQRREPRKVLAIPRTSTLAKIPRGSTISAPEVLGGTNQTWRVDGYDRVEADLFRVIVILD